MSRLRRLRGFILESNRIEGIHREPTTTEVDALDWFLAADTLTRGHLITLTTVFQPDARLRDLPGLDVYVGTHCPPPGGPRIADALDDVLDRASHGEHPYPVHVAYETLHPFTDGNGRSGRALWLRGMNRRSPREQRQAWGLGFLHCWYYQSLEHARVGE